MNWSLILLPLLGGYFHLSKSIKTKFFYRRIERQRLIFDSLLVGFIYTIIGYLSWAILSYLCKDFTEFLFVLIGFNSTHFIPLSISLIAAILNTYAFNFLNRRDANWFLSRVILKTGNSLQKDLMESYFFQRLIMVALQNGKVYVGFAGELNEPNIESSYIRMVLFYSGYRTHNMDISLETDYNLKFDEKELEEDDITMITLKESEILSSTFFNQNVFKRLNNGTLN